MKKILAVLAFVVLVIGAFAVPGLTSTDQSKTETRSHILISEPFKISGEMAFYVKDTNVNLCYITTGISSPTMVPCESLNYYFGSGK